MADQLFTIEAVAAKHGDALILHYGDPASPKRILVDGGPPGVFNRYLQPRLRMLRNAWTDGTEPLDLEAVIISHVDQDHVAGVLDLFEDIRDRRLENRRQLVRTGAL